MQHTWRTAIVVAGAAALALLSACGTSSGGASSTSANASAAPTPAVPSAAATTTSAPCPATMPDVSSFTWPLPADRVIESTTVCHYVGFEVATTLSPALTTTYAGFPLDILMSSATLVSPNGPCTLEWTAPLVTALRLSDGTAETLVVYIGGCPSVSQPGALGLFFSDVHAKNALEYFQAQSMKRATEPVCPLTAPDRSTVAWPLPTGVTVESSAICRYGEGGVDGALSSDDQLGGLPIAKLLKHTSTADPGLCTTELRGVIPLALRLSDGSSGVLVIAPDGCPSIVQPDGANLWILGAHAKLNLLNFQAYPHNCQWIKPNYCRAPIKTKRPH